MLQPATDFTSISQVIQLAVAPVFLLAGVGALLNVLANRLGRAVDRARLLEADLDEAAAEDQERLRGDIGYHARRARLIYGAMALCVLCALLVCSAIVVQFVNAFLRISLDPLVALLFVGALLSLIGALALFLREVHLAIANLRIGPR
jgi:hypothetical protein